MGSKGENVDSDFRISKEGEVSGDGSFVLTKVMKGEKSGAGWNDVSRRKWGGREKRGGVEEAPFPACPSHVNSRPGLEASEAGEG